jgi:hypothetical protein
LRLGAERTLAHSSLYWSLFQLILFVDTLPFTIGYLIEVPAIVFAASSRPSSAGSSEQAQRTGAVHPQAAR